MDKIEILIKNNKDFGDVAFLVDKSEFLEAISKLRSKWRIKNLLPLNKFVEWEQKLFDEREIKQAEQQKLAKQLPSNISDSELEWLQEKVARVMPDVDFECDVRDIRIRFNKPETFDKAISYAVVCGTIPDGIYKSTYWRVDPSASPPLRLQDRTIRIAIYVTPQSQNEEVLQALREIRTRVFKDRNDGYTPFFSLYNKDEISNIKRDRHWYWENLNGKSYQDIAISENKSKKYFEKAKDSMKKKTLNNLSIEKREEYRKHLNWIQDYSEAIRKAIKRYIRALSAT